MMEDIPPPKNSFAPVAVPGATVLLLGSLPGDESLRQQQYYAHPRNAFWSILGEIYHFDPALPYLERLEYLTRNGVALWDVLASGSRPGSLDGNIRNPVPNAIPALLKRIPTIRRIGCNGGAAYTFLKRSFPTLFASDIAVFRLPSTSPAAAAITRAEKLAAFRHFLED